MGEVFKLNHCYNMDCLPAMELFPDNYFDLAVVDETFGTWESDFSSFKIWMKLRKNFNPPVRWEAAQDKRRNPKPLGRNTYLYKARKIKSLARSTHTRASLHKGKQKGTEEQCKHTFKITAARCAPCSGYNVECKHYEKNSAADTKHGSSRT